jgi:hypothetical protein
MQAVLRCVDAQAFAGERPGERRARIVPCRSSRRARPSTTAVVPTHGCSSCSVGSSACRKRSGVRRDAPRCSIGDGPDRELRIGGPPRVERNVAVASIASSTMRAAASSVVIPTAGLAVWTGRYARATGRRFRAAR